MSTVTPPAAAPAGNGMPARTHQMLHAPVVATLFRLATPNIIGLFAMPLVIGYDGFILGRLGANALAGVALVFPLSMLMIQISGGGIGAATTAAVARALGAGRSDDASRVAQQALFIAFVAAALFTLAQFGLGSAVYAAMGGRGAALADALAYSNVLFGGAVLIWFSNVLAAVVRGAGNMLLPSVTLLGTALVHLALCPLLVFGWGPLPGLGSQGLPPVRSPSMGWPQRCWRCISCAAMARCICIGCRGACARTCWATSCAWACRPRSAP